MPSIISTMPDKDILNDYKHLLSPSGLEVMRNLEQRDQISEQVARPDYLDSLRENKSAPKALQPAGEYETGEEPCATSRGNGVVCASSLAQALPDVVALSQRLSFLQKLRAREALAPLTGLREIERDYEKALSLIRDGAE